MIEPQNSFLPLASEPRPAEGMPLETAGFGEMLAQSLGMQIDPVAVQQIDTGQSNQSFDADGSAEEGEESAQDVTLVAGAEARPIAPPVLPVRPGLPVTPPGNRELQPPIPGDNAELPFTGKGAPVRSLPQPPLPVAAVDKAEPIEGIWKPAPTAAPAAEPISAPPVVAGNSPTLEPELPADGPAPAQAPSFPVVGPTGRQVAPVPVTTPEPAPVIGAGTDPKPPASPEPGVPSVPPAKTPVPRFGGGQLGLEPGQTAPAGDVVAPVVQRPGTGRRVPPPPAPDSVATPSNSVPVQSDRMVWSPAERLAVDPGPAVRVDTPARVVTPAPTERGVDGTVGRLTELGGQTPVTAASGDASVPKSAPNATGSTVSAQTSALAERVMQAIDMQRTQPPPRSMVVDIPEVEGLRLVVSVRSGGQVSVAPATGSANPDAFAPFATDLSRVLADRGFVMTGDGRQRGHNPYNTDEQASPAPRRQTFRRSAPVDNDLRI